MVLSIIQLAVSYSSVCVPIGLRKKDWIVPRSLVYLFHSADIIGPNNNSQI